MGALRNDIRYLRKMVVVGTVIPLPSEDVSKYKLCSITLGERESFIDF